jgi:hypothetical protein
MPKQQPAAKKDRGILKQKQKNAKKNGSAKNGSNYRIYDIKIFFLKKNHRV